jgi:hypothetical protein
MNVDDLLALFAPRFPISLVLIVTTGLRCGCSFFSGLGLETLFTLSLFTSSSLVTFFLFLFFPLSPVPCAYDLSLSYSNLVYTSPSAVLIRPIYYIIHHPPSIYTHLVPNDFILTPAGRI